MPKYLGPGASFELAGKVYYPGDNVPASKELIEHLQRYTQHQFEGHETTLVAVATNERIRRYDDRGQALFDVDAQHRRGTAPAAATETEKK